MPHDLPEATMDGARAPRLAVVAGGTVGTLARVLVSRAMPVAALPWGTLAANVSGALLLGLLVGAVEERGRPSPTLVVLAGTGMLGAYTTFSALAAESLDLLRVRPAVGLAYVTLSIAGGILAAVTGRRLGHSIGAGT